MLRAYDVGNVALLDDTSKERAGIVSRRRLHTLRGRFNWNAPRRWCSGDFDLPPLRGTQPGRLRLWAEDDMQYGEYEYILEADFTDSEEGFSLGIEHGDGIVSLGRVLGVALGAPTHITEFTYVLENGGRWCPMMPKLLRTMWDWRCPPGDILSPTDMGAFLSRLPTLAQGPLVLLSEAVNVDNPVARYVCIWQALVFHVGTDSPRKLDEAFFERLGVPLESEGPQGPESKYTSFRNTLSHPMDRGTPAYAELDAIARELSDKLAMLLLDDILKATQSEETRE